MDNFYVSGHSVIGRRIAAFFIDYAVILVIITVPALFTGNGFSGAFNIYILSAFILEVFKDIFHGRSPGKRLMGLKVIISGNVESVPSAPKLLLRNLLLLIWPVEAILALRDRYGKRLGDRVAKTEVIGLFRYNKLRTAITVVLAVIVLFCTLFVFVTQSIKSDPAYSAATSYIENSLEIKDAVGNIKGFGFFISGSIETFNGNGEADLKIPVYGTERDITVEIMLTKEPSSDWNVESISY